MPTENVMCEAKTVPISFGFQCSLYMLILISCLLQVKYANSVLKHTERKFLSKASLATVFSRIFCVVGSSHPYNVNAQHCFWLWFGLITDSLSAALFHTACFYLFLHLIYQRSIKFRSSFWIVCVHILFSSITLQTIRKEDHVKYVGIWIMVMVLFLVLSMINSMRDYTKVGFKTSSLTIAHDEVSKVFRLNVISDFAAFFFLVFRMKVAIYTSLATLVTCYPICLLTYFLDRIDFMHENSLEVKQEGNENAPLAQVELQMYESVTI